MILKKWARWANVIRKVQKYQQVRYHFIQLPIVNVPFPLCLIFCPFSELSLSRTSS